MKELLLLLIILAIFFLYGDYRSGEHKKLFNRWLADCRSIGGKPELYAQNRWECFVNGEMVVVKGYEGY